MAFESRQFFRYLINPLLVVRLVQFRVSIAQISESRLALRRDLLTTLERSRLPGVRQLFFKTIAPPEVRGNLRRKARPTCAGTSYRSEPYLPPRLSVLLARPSPKTPRRILLSSDQQR